LSRGPFQTRSHRVPRACHDGQQAPGALKEG
jgi:hypothetical protein